MDQRREFVMLAKQEGVNRRKLCRQFGISAETGYKWIQRYDAGDTTLGPVAAAASESGAHGGCD